jgi:hypothetical protein
MNKDLHEMTKSFGLCVVNKATDPNSRGMDTNKSHAGNTK